MLGSRNLGSSRIAGNLVPLTPTMPSFPTLPLRRRSNMDSPTTPTFLSDSEAPPPTKPVVYSPVPTIKTLSGSILGVGSNVSCEQEQKND